MAPLKAIELVLFINVTVDLAAIVEGDYDLGMGYKILMIVGIIMAIFIMIVIGVITKREL